MEKSMNVDTAKLLRQVLTELEDAVLFSDRVNDCRSELQDIQNRKEEHIRKEKKIRDDVKAILDAYARDENLDFFKNFHDSIVSHTNSILDEYEKNLSDYLNKDLTAKEQEMDSYKSKSVRALETFFSRDPFDSLEAAIGLKYVEGGYEARYKCVCQKELEYEFMLNASEVEFLKTKLEASTLSRGLKLPVRFAKTWVSKDPVVDYEKLDPYYLDQASISDSNLFVTFRNDETSSEFKFHSSSSEGTAFLEIDYKDSIQAVSLTTQPALNSNLNRENVMQFLNHIKTALLYLKDHKLRLVNIFLRGADVIAGMKVTDVFYTALEILAPKLTEEISRIVTEKEQVAVENEKPLNRDFIVNRLSLLGEKAKNVSSILGIPGFSDSISKN